MIMTTAESVYHQILEMPVAERERLFGLIARRGFEKDLYTFNEVFDDLKGSPFTVKEAAEYLEVSEITVRRLVKRGSLKVVGKIGRSLVFDIDELRVWKRKSKTGKNFHATNQKTSAEKM
jgi:excisionase family DNA binding protein